MGLEGGPRLMKITLIVFNVLVLIGGCLTIGLGVWSLTADYGASDMAAVTGSDLYEGACIVVIVGGSVVALLSLIGCCGACMECRWLLAFYFSALLVMLTVFIVGAVIGFVYRGDLEDELEDELTETLKTKYDMVTDDDDENQDVTDIWNKIQNKLKCCGVRGGITSTSSWLLWQESQWYLTQQQFEKDLVPTSCCNTDDGYTFDQCQRENSDSTQPPQVNTTVGVGAENPALYSVGCIDKLKDEIDDHLVAIAVSAIVVVIVTLLCAIFAVCVYKQIGKQNMVV